MRGKEVIVVRGGGGGGGGGCEYCHAGSTWEWHFVAGDGIRRVVDGKPCKRSSSREREWQVLAGAWQSKGEAVAWCHTAFRALTSQAQCSMRVYVKDTLSLGIYSTLSQFFGGTEF